MAYTTELKAYDVYTETGDLIATDVDQNTAAVLSNMQVDGDTIEGTVEEWGRCDVIGYAIMPHGTPWTAFDPDTMGY